MAFKYYVSLVRKLEEQSRAFTSFLSGVENSNLYMIKLGCLDSRNSVQFKSSLTCLQTNSRCHSWLWRHRPRLFDRTCRCLCLFPFQLEMPYCLLPFYLPHISFGRLSCLLRISSAHQMTDENKYMLHCAFRYKLTALSNLLSACCTKASPLFSASFSLPGSSP